MENKSLLKSAVLMVIITVCVVLCWEMYLRNLGVNNSYDDGPPLWSYTREKVYQSPSSTVVFIGSSRNKYDLDITTWKNQTGFDAVQLAIEGTCPRPILEDLANDPNFKGKLIIDVTEGLFFSNAPPNIDEPVKNIKYYHDRTPAQQASFALNKPLESIFVFLDKDFFSLNAKLNAMEIPSRPGVFMMPIFPWKFSRNTFDRQTVMTKDFANDPKLCNQVKGVWYFFSQLNKHAPPMQEKELNAIFTSVKIAIDKIKSRGGEVIFVRTPSSGPYYEGENMAFPKEKYWSKLLQITNCPGIHFKDYPAIANLNCPEFSHLSPTDAKIFTQHFIQILNNEKGWEFPVSKYQKLN
ncbi:hypothetical protein [Flavobacterium granuli]|uniref:SGNH/GDSL hydrolase family protein n=1 Tax=Flavobacterium granuli TaxID=280093 RepID=A0ABU1S0M0_9FLAO|nr:hypothetical protein [Flavobacterium granuli]MDR6844578.1 hypothetical protein [Flavobacterium granuli]